MEQKFCQSCGMPLTGQPMEQREQSDACIDSAESRQRKTEGQVLGTNGRSSESHPSSLEDGRVVTDEGEANADGTKRSTSGRLLPTGRKNEDYCKALVVIDIQNDITKHYRDIIDNINAAIEWAVAERLRLEKNGNACGSMHGVYIKHHNITAATRTFKPGSKGEELVPEMKVVSDNIFVKTKSNALTSEAFSAFIEANGINEFYVAGADATACVKSTCFNMTKAGFTVHVLSDCVTSYDLKKLPEMFAYYESKGCEVKTLADYKQ